MIQTGRVKRKCFAKRVVIQLQWLPNKLVYKSLDFSFSKPKICPVTHKIYFVSGNLFKLLRYDWFWSHFKNLKVQRKISIQFKVLLQSFNVIIIFFRFFCIFLTTVPPQCVPSPPCLISFYINRIIKQSALGKKNEHVKNSSLRYLF